MRLQSYSTVSLSVTNKRNAAQNVNSYHSVHLPPVEGNPRWKSELTLAEVLSLPAAEGPAVRVAHRSCIGPLPALNPLTSRLHPRSQGSASPPWWNSLEMN